MGDKTQLYMCEREIVGQFIKLWSMCAACLSNYKTLHMQARVFMQVMIVAIYQHRSLSTIRSS